MRKEQRQGGLRKLNRLHQAGEPDSRRLQRRAKEGTQQESNELSCSPGRNRGITIPDRRGKMESFAVLLRKSTILIDSLTESVKSIARMLPRRQKRKCEAVPSELQKKRWKEPRTQ